MQTAANTDRALFAHASMGIVVVNSKGAHKCTTEFVEHFIGVAAFY